MDWHSDQMNANGLLHDRQSLIATKPISLPKDADVSAVAFDVLDPVRARQLLHQGLEAPQTVRNPWLEFYLAQSGALKQELVCHATEILIGKLNGPC